MQVKFKKLHPDARMPEYIHSGDAGANIFSLEDRVLLPGERYTFKLGFGTEFAQTHMAWICDRSGLASKSGLTCLGGVIDSNYRGEWAVVILNTSNQEYQFKRGDKIAQILFQTIEVVQFEEVHELPETSRADGGFGSTGR